MKLELKLLVFHWTSIEYIHLKVVLFQLTETE
jgi:hypothetical protein